MELTAEQKKLFEDARNEWLKEMFNEGNTVYINYGERWYLNIESKKDYDLNTVEIDPCDYNEFKDFVTAVNNGIKKIEKEQR